MAVAVESSSMNKGDTAAGMVAVAEPCIRMVDKTVGIVPADVVGAKDKCALDHLGLAAADPAAASLILLCYRSLLGRGPKHPSSEDPSRGRMFALLGVAAPEY